LARGGSGSLDVVEIDAASHNGVDDARDLRERAIFAPARDRFKIFILDEAHMVTPQGFNALLKIVEEPPAHVKFIFATTEPEKVIGTIRSRTHHYPFRLVPPGELLEYLSTVLAAEGFSAADGVMPMVVRASGGSVRDALSLLDQLIAGSDSKEIDYVRATNLLGFTHDSLMSEVIEAFAELDAGQAFRAVDKVIQSGQDARRFLEDLLERIRDLMLVSSLGKDAKAILRGIGPEQFELLVIQASRFGLSQLTQTAEATAKALAETSAASNPRLQLELLCARVLAPVAQSNVAVARTMPATEPKPVLAKAPAVAKSEPAPMVVVEEAPERVPEVVTEDKTEAIELPKPPAKANFEASTASFKANWSGILEVLSKKSRSAWAVAFTTKVIDFEGDVLTLLFQSQKDVDAFKNSNGASEVLRSVIKDMFGVIVKYRAKVAEAPEPVVSAPVIEPTEPEEFTEEADYEEPETGPVVVAQSDEKAGEFMLREVLGAEPIKGDN
jgi:DNA polymerase-3 subunit gamma/tau